MNVNKEQAEAMLAAGLRDRLTLRLLRESGEAPAEAIGFHAQQACEKFLKTVLVMHGLIFERTHDLAVVFSLVNKPLLTAAMQRFRQTRGADFAPDQAEALALGLGKSAGESLSLTDIRGLGLSTTQQAKTVADRLVAQKLLEPLSEERFQVPEQIRQRFELETAQVTEQVGTKSGLGPD
jgi:hypothetical protein